MYETEEKVLPLDFINQIPQTTDPLQHVKSLSDTVTTNVTERRAFEEWVMNRQGQAHIIDGISHLEVGPVERPSAFQKLQAIIRILNRGPTSVEDAVFFIRGLITEIVALLNYIEEEEEPKTEVLTVLNNGVHMLSYLFEMNDSHQKGFDPKKTGISYFLDKLTLFLYGNSKDSNVRRQNDRVEIVDVLLGELKHDLLQNFALQHLLANTKVYFNRILIGLKNDQKEGILEFCTINSLFALFRLLENQLLRMKLVKPEDLVALESLERVAQFAFPSFGVIGIATTSVVKHGKFLAQKTETNSVLTNDQMNMDGFNERSLEDILRALLS